MNPSVPREVDWQRQYYGRTAANYDAMHEGDREHSVALAMLVGMLDLLDVRSVLDVGSGTGRALRYLKRAKPALVVKGVEPVVELRQAAVAHGVPPEDMLEADALALPFADRAFDVVCAFGVLHHIRTPERAVSEMLRVANRAIFISDSNNFGQGSLLARTAKQVLHRTGLWPIANFLKTGGRGHHVSDGDGLAYSYSLFSSYPQIRARCSTVHLMNTTPATHNLYRSASHVALLGVK